MARLFTYRGKSFEEIQKLSLTEFAELLPARERRSIKRGFTDAEKKFLACLKAGEKDLKTHTRELVILPEMVGKTIKVYNGKEWVMVMVEAEMLGHRLGEFSQTRRTVKHSAPGIGATKSSASLSVR